MLSNFPGIGEAATVGEAWRARETIRPAQRSAMNTRAPFALYSKLRAAGEPD